MRSSVNYYDATTSHWNYRGLTLLQDVRLLPAHFRGPDHRLGRGRRRPRPGWSPGGALSGVHGLGVGLGFPLVVSGAHVGVAWTDHQSPGSVLVLTHEVGLKTVQGATQTIRQPKGNDLCHTTLLGSGSPGLRVRQRPFFLGPSFSFLIFLCLFERKLRGRHSSEQRQIKREERTTTKLILLHFYEIFGHFFSC